MKKRTLYAAAAIAAIALFATACGSKTSQTSTTAANTEVSSEAVTESGAQKSTENTADSSAEAEKTEGVSSETSEKADAEVVSEKTGTIKDIKDFMFTLDEDGTEYAFSFDQEKKPEGLADVKDGDKVTVSYTGTVDEVDSFNGTVLSVTKAD